MRCTPAGILPRLTHWGRETTLCDAAHATVRSVLSANRPTAHDAVESCRWISVGLCGRCHAHVPDRGAGGGPHSRMLTRTRTGSLGSLLPKPAEGATSLQKLSTPPCKVFSCGPWFSGYRGFMKFIVMQPALGCKSEGLWRTRRRCGSVGLGLSATRDLSRL